MVELVDKTRPVQKLVGGKIKLKYKVCSHEDIINRANKSNDEGSHLDGSIENNSKSDQDDSSLPDKKLFVWEMKRPALDPLPAPPFDLAQQRPEEEQAQPSTLDDCENEDRNKQKFWYIECLSREMGLVLESAESNVLPTGLDKEEFVSEHSVESNAVHQGSLNKWPPPTELNRCNTNLHDPALDGNCLFNSLIHFLKHWITEMIMR